MTDKQVSEEFSIFVLERIKSRRIEITHFYKLTQIADYQYAFGYLSDHEYATDCIYTTGVVRWSEKVFEIDCQTSVRYKM